MYAEIVEDERQDLQRRAREEGARAAARAAAERAAVALLQMQIVGDGAQGHLRMQLLVQALGETLANATVGIERRDGDAIPSAVADLKKAQADQDLGRLVRDIAHIVSEAKVTGHCEENSARVAALRVSSSVSSRCSRCERGAREGGIG